MITFLMATISSKVKDAVVDAGTCVVKHSKRGLSSSRLAMPPENMYKDCTVVIINSTFNTYTVLGKIASINFISVRDGPENTHVVQKKGRDERMQEDYLTSAKSTQQM